MAFGLTNSGRAFVTPDFQPTDPMVCKSITLRPSIWTVVWFLLQELGSEWSWRQDDPAHATVEEVITEIENATDNAIFTGCIMIGEIKELVLNTVPDWLLPCDGTEYLGADYPLLWAVIHDNLKTDATHFRTPDRARRVGWGEAVGAQEGAEKHTLTFAELPAEATNVASDYIELESGSLGFALYDINGYGGGGAHNNIQPTEGAQFYIVAALPVAG